MFFGKEIADMGTYHYALRTILLDDILTFLDRLAEAVGEPRLRECLAGKYARLFTECSITSCQILPRLKVEDPYGQVNKEEDEKEEGLNLDSFQELIGMKMFQDNLEFLLRLAKGVDLGEFGVEEVGALKQIAESQFTLADIARVIEESPDEVSDLVKGVNVNFCDPMSVADLVEMLE